MKKTGKTTSAVIADKISVDVPGKFLCLKYPKQIKKRNTEKKQDNYKAGKAENIEVEYLKCFKIDV